MNISSGIKRSIARDTLVDPRVELLLWLFFVGIDVINGKLIEVNVQSPGGIMRINKLNNVKLQRKVIDFIESVIQAKEALSTRKTEFRKAIEDAQVI